MKRFVFDQRFGQMFRIRFILGNGREGKCAAKCIKIPKNGRFRNIKFQNFPGEHAPRTPLAGSPFGRGSGLWPLNFRTQVPTFRTQVKTGLGKNLFHSSKLTSIVLLESVWIILSEYISIAICNFASQMSYGQQTKTRQKCNFSTYVERTRKGQTTASFVLCRGLSMVRFPAGGSTYFGVSTWGSGVSHSWI